MPKRRAPYGAPLAWLQAAMLVETDDCQHWPFSLTPCGYGQLRWEGHRRLAHHVALILVGREVPVRPLETRHLCGNGNLGCVNPRHLVLGTHAENMADRITHGTSNRGAKNGQAKLTSAQVLAIREAPGSPKEVAAKFGISRYHVADIKRRKRWGHL